MPGDVIQMEVYAKYIDTNSANWTTALNTLITGIANGTAPAGTVTDGSAYSTNSANPFSFTGLNGTASSSGTGPKAYLSYLVFDKDFNVILPQSGYQRLSATPKEDGQNVAHEKLSAQITINQPGYVYIYLSNEEAAPVEVYFDDMKVTQVKSPIIQSEDYYPFGLTFNDFARENSIRNKYLYNKGAERIDDLGLNWDYTFYRTYDPALGRFIQIDPKVEEFYDWNPYNYAYDSPVLHNDPLGDCEKCQQFLQGVGEGFVGTFTGAYEGAKSLASDPVGTVTNYVENYSVEQYAESVADVFTFGGYSTAKTAAGVTEKAANGDALGIGKVVGEKGAQVVIAVVTDATFRGVKSLANTKPAEAYSRTKHYGNTPTKADRTALGAGKGQVVDHKTPLVKHYYEGSGKGGKPGHKMTQAERQKFAKDRGNMQLQSTSDSNKQGGQMSTYSKNKKKELGL